MKHFTCSQLLPGCPASFSAASVEEIVALASRHATASHGLVGYATNYRVAVAATVI
ncbi:MAG: DUF1059 domain-containing protein [Actinomycetota bacterium]|nr:DUF1059 domain-containing protein [Actinomycetota bacterium]